MPGLAVGLGGLEPSLLDASGVPGALVGRGLPGRELLVQPPHGVRDVLGSARFGSNVTDGTVHGNKFNQGKYRFIRGTGVA